MKTAIWPAHRAKRLALLGLSPFFVFAGLNHFVNPDFYLRIMPPWLPSPELLVQISGAFEILGGLGVLWPKTRVWSGIGLVLLLIAVFPANLQMALHPEPFLEDGIPLVALHLRLPLQLVFVVWTFWATRS